MISKINGYYWKIINLLTFSIISLITKSFVNDLSVFQIFFCFKSIALLITFLVFCYQYRRYPRLMTDYLSILRALVNVTALVLWFAALRKLEINDATIISYTTPLFGVLIGITLFKEKFYKYIFYALILGALGCYVIIKPNLQSTLTGVIFCLASAFLWSIHDSLIKMQTSRKQPILESMFQSLFLTSIIALPMTIKYWVTPASEINLLVIVCGVLSFINLYSLGSALQKEDMSLLMPISFVRIIFISIGGYLFYNETINAGEAVGFSLIFFANYLILKTIKRKKLYSEGAAN